MDVTQRANDELSTILGRESKTKVKMDEQKQRSNRHGFLQHAPRPGQRSIIADRNYAVQSTGVQSANCKRNEHLKNALRVRFQLECSFLTLSIPYSLER